MERTKIDDGELLSFVGYDGERHLVTNTEELDSQLSELPSGAYLFRSRLFSYTENITRPLQQGICLSFRQFGKLGCHPPVFRSLEDNRSNATTFRSVFCECDGCSKDQSCGIGSILEINFRYYKLAKNPRSHKSHWLPHGNLQTPSKESHSETSLAIDNGAIRLGGDFWAEPAWAQFRILRYTTPYGCVNVETFHMGPLPLKPTGHTTLSYVLTQMGLICDAWDELLVVCKAKLLALGGRVLADAKYLQGDRALTQELSKFTEMCEKFCEVQQSHLEAVRQLRFPKENGLDVFFNRADTLPAYDSQRKQLSETLKRLEDIGETIKEDLVDAARQLVSKVEARRVVFASEECNPRNLDEIMKILILLPPLLLFVNVFGMNASIYLLAVISVVLFLGRYTFEFFQSKIQRTDAVETGSTRESSATTGPVYATKNTLYGAVRHLLRECADANGPGIGYTNPGGTSLQTAAGGGHLGVVNLLIQEGTITNVPGPPTSGGLTALQTAVGGGHLGVAKCLLRGGGSRNGLTALDTAAGECHIEVVERLFNEKPGVDARGYCSKGHITLYLAAKGGHREVIERLLNGKADVNAPGYSLKGWTTLPAAAGTGNLEIIEYLIKEKVDVNIICKDVAALQTAAGGGYLEAVERLLQKKPDVNANVSPHDFTALHAIAGAGHLKIDKRLLLEKAEINTQMSEEQNWAVLQAAAEGGHLEINVCLCQWWADVYAPALVQYGRTELPVATGMSRPEVVKRLPREKTNTALYATAMGGHLQVAEPLLEEKVDINASGDSLEGQAALEGVATGLHLSIVERLVREKADVNMPYGQFDQSHLEISEYLFREKADVNADSSGCGWTALYLVVQGGHLKGVKLLLRGEADLRVPQGVVAAEASRREFGL